MIAMMSMCLPLSFGHWEGHEKAQCQSNVKVLRDSAAALQTSHPDLAKSLTEMASQKEEGMKKMKAMHEASLQNVENAATALQTSNPELSKGLKDYADREAKEEMGTAEMPAMQKEDRAATIKLLKDAGEALKPLNPELAMKLTAMANMKEMKTQCMKDANNQPAEMEKEASM
jgi:transketolase